MKQFIVKIMRIIRILCLFGITGGVKYLYYFGKYGKGIGYKKKIRLKYAGGYIVIRTDSTDLPLVESILVGRLINRKWQGEYCVAERYLNYIDISNPVVVDAGANIGLFSLLIKREFPEASIYAIEPERDNYRMLCSNCIDTCQRGGILTLCRGLWSKDAYLKVIPRESGEWGYIVHEVDKEDTDAIQAISIKSLILQNNLKKIDLLKMDIEGSEYEIFKSDDLEWLDICDAVVIETHDNIINGVDKLVNTKMIERGYVKYIYDENQLFIKKKGETKHE